MVLDHAFYVQLFNGNHAVTVNDFAGDLVNKVMPTVANPLMDARDDLLGFPPLAGAANLFGEFPLSLCQSILVLAKEAWIFDVLTVGKRRKGFQPNVNVYFINRRRQEFGATLSAFP